MPCHSILINKKQLIDKAIGCLQCSSVAKQHNLLFMSLEKIYLIQECIPVGCIPPAAAALKGGLHTTPPGVGTPLSRHSPKAGTPGAGTPRVGTP